MGSVGIPTSDPGRGGRIEQIVERERSRSKRVLLIYAALLIIPLAAGAYYYQYGRTDVDLVHREVNSKIEPIRNIVDIVKRTEPALLQVQQTAAQLTEQQAQLQSISQKQEALATTVQAVPDKLQQIDKINTDLSDVSKQVEAVRVNSEKLQDTTQAGMGRLSERINAVSSTQARLETNLQGIQTRVEQIRTVNYEDRLRGQQEIIDNLRQRIQKLEQRPVAPIMKRPQ